MNSDKVKILRPQKVKTELTGRPAGIARSHRIIMVDKAIESQFIKICSQIKLDDKRKDRAENQRNERRMKRKSVDFDY